MVHPYPGTFTVIDGLDGVGKGVIIEGLVAHVREQGARVFSLDEYSNTHHYHPEFDPANATDRTYHPLDDFDVLVSSEPTYVQIGQAIRDEVIRTNGRLYSTRMTAQLYADDRLILHKRILLPALAAGKHILQSRCVASSIVYQALQEPAP